MMTRMKKKTKVYGKDKLMNSGVDPLIYSFELDLNNIFYDFLMMRFVFLQIVQT